MDHLKELLYKYWGYSSFRSLQENIINSVLTGKDTLAVLPTGGGKSICYQLPALKREGVCIVISPLIALMKDQVDGLKKRGIMAAAIYAGMSQRMVVQTLKNVAYGPYKFLYVSPERLQTNLFREYLPAIEVNLIAVDEAHCISQWGYDFRPSYLKVIELRNEIPEVPVLALTASATLKVQLDICEKLGFSNENIFRKSFDRKNLKYSIINTSSKFPKILDIVQRTPGSAIIYCGSRRRTLEISKLLQLQGVLSDYYHAGLQAEERVEKQNRWINNQTKVIVSTNAFGMGIDKPDVRLVLHVDPPDSLESYYQEAGRAGRDDKESLAILLYNSRDVEEMTLSINSRYPSFKEIKTVYQALVNYLQIPVFSGQDQSYPFYLETFIKQFKLNCRTTLFSLKALEQDGWISLQERSFTPSTIEFTTKKEYLYQFQKDHQDLEPLIAGLLRTYAGIFNFPCRISEPLLAKTLNQKTDVIITGLKRLNYYQIIEYIQQSDKPQLVFLKQRVAVEDLQFDLKAHNKRKQNYTDRINGFISYFRTKSCRNVFINRYFGDESSSPCGLCDNCLVASKGIEYHFDFLINKVVEYLKNGPVTINILCDNLNIKKEDIYPVLNHLQSEHILKVADNGDLHLKSL